MRNINLILIVIILLPTSILSQEERKLNKKEANEEVKRLIILTEKLQSEKEELNNKLMIEYEKLLSEMDENSNLRIQNGEFRSEIRTMQKNLIDLQKSYSDKENLVLDLNTYIETLKNNTRSDSILTINLSDSIINLNDSIINLNDSIINLNEISNSKAKEIISYFSLLLYLEDASVGNGGDAGIFNFYYLDEETENKKDFIMEALADEVILKGSLIESGFYGWEFDENGVPEKKWVKKELYKVTFKLDICGYEIQDICYKLIELELAKELSEIDLKKIPNLY